MRATESLYWLAAKIKCGDKNMHLAQWEAYNIESELSSTDAIEVIIDYCLNKNMIEFNASTSIMILPGFKFRFADRLITNFHQPKSTLLMLVAAFIGDDWKKIYDFALNHNFRFLSYGDSSLLQRNT